MAFNREKIYKQAIEAIKEHNLFSVEDVIAFVPCSGSTFYEFFPASSDELVTIKDLLNDNKVRTKARLRDKLEQGRGSELIALYKLISTIDERKILADRFEGDNDTNLKIIVVEE